MLVSAATGVRSPSAEALAGELGPAPAELGPAPLELPRRAVPVPRHRDSIPGESLLSLLVDFPGESLLPL